MNPNFQRRERVCLNPNTDLIMYTTDDGITKVEATFDGDTVWLVYCVLSDIIKKSERPRNKQQYILLNGIYAKYWK